MNYKVLIADDSNNIQKVVKIIYEDRNIEIVSCQDSSKLEELQSEKFDLILLDFSLDENVEGYDLAISLKEKFKTKIILLFGTFDSIDEDKVESSKVDGYLFKPFDSDKLLKLTDEVLEISNEGGPSENLVAEDTQILNPSDQTITKTIHPVDAVGDETAWGIKIPGIIGEEEEPENTESFSLNEDNQRIPDIIESDLTRTIVGGINSLEIGEEEEEATVYPSDEDLEYPAPEEIEAIEQTGTVDIDLEKDIDIEVEASSSKLIPSQDLLVEAPDEIDLPDSTEIVDMDMSQDKEKETLKKLKQQIFEELDEDLWSEDHTNTNILMGELGKDVVNQNQSVTAVHSKKDILEGLKADFYTEIRNEVLEGLRSELPELLKDELIPYFEEHIKAYCKEAVERGIWEILPDLAEKVIKKELEEIRKTID